MRTIFFMNVIIIINTILIYLLSSCEDYISMHLDFLKGINFNMVVWSIFFIDLILKKHHLQYGCKVFIAIRVMLSRTRPESNLYENLNFPQQKINLIFL